MSRKKTPKPTGKKLSNAVLALYGDVQLIKAYCERCESNAFVINGRLACCGFELKVNPKHQYRESPIKNIDPEMRERIKHHSDNRKARMEDNGGSHTIKEWRDLCKKYSYLCLCCGERKPLTEDHIIPVVLGGTDDISNIQPLCQECNCRKSGKFIDYRPKFS